MIYFESKEKTQIPLSYVNLSSEKRQNIDLFLNNIVEHAYLVGKEFFVRDLVGKDVFPNGWEGLPIYDIYLANKNKTNPILQAGIDIGLLVKECIKKSKHSFKLIKGFNNSYLPLK